MSSTRSTRRMNGADRRKQLLSTARRRFAADGYHATTMSSIARAAGVSEPLLFKHFGSKEELFRHSIVDPLLALLRSHTGEPPTDEPVESHEQALRSFFITWASLVREERSLAMTLVAELQHFPDVARELATIVQGHVVAIAARNASITDRPEYRRFDHMVSTWSGLATATIAGLVADDLDAFVDAYLDILLYGVRAS